MHESAVFFVNVLEASARLLFTDNYSRDVLYDTIKVILRREYDPPTCNDRVQTSVCNLRLYSFMAQKKYEKHEMALKKSLEIKKLFLQAPKLFLQAPTSFRVDSHKVQCLRRTVLGPPRT